MTSSRETRPQRGGDPAPERHLPDLVASVYEDLLAIARSYWVGQPIDATLQPTALVHEAVLKVLTFDRARAANGEPGGAADVEHLLAILARAMRQVLVDQARQRGSAKRRGGDRIDLLTVTAPDAGMPAIDLLDLDMALDELASHDARAVRIIELRFFARFSVDEVADTLRIGKTTAEEEWRLARAWLKRRLRELDQDSRGA